MKIKKKYYLFFTILVFVNSSYAQESYKADNVVALTKLIGIVKYFYPSETIQKTDWNNLTRYALIDIKNIKTNNALKDSLNKIFSSVAPELKILFKNEASALQKKYRNTENGYKVRYWEHYGYGYDRKDFSFFTKLFIPWKSKLETNTLHDLPANVPTPDSVYIFPINDSLICAMPLCISVKKSTSPKANIMELTVNDDRIEQFSVLINIWNVLQHFYVYLDDTGYDWEDFLSNMIFEINKGISTEKFENLIRNSLVKLNDRHIWFETRKNKNLTISRYKHEVLPIDLMFVENQAVVSKVNFDSIDIKRGDIITAINDKSIVSTLNMKLGLADEQKKLKPKKYFVENLLYKYVGDTVKLTIKSNNTFADRYIFIDKKEINTDLIQEIEKGYFYIDLTLISRQALKENLKKLTNAKGIIADSRYRTGSAFEYFISLITNEPVSSGNWFNPTFRYPNRENVQFDKVKPWIIYPDKKQKIKAPVVFLSGHNCFSNGESNLEIIKYYKLGTIIGEATAGVNGDMNIAYIDKNYVLTFTQLLVLNRDNSVFFGHGITPDIELKPTIEAIKKNDDYLLKYALNYLKKQMQ